MKKEHELHELPNKTNEEKMIYQELKIMQAVFEVHNILCPGYSDFIRVIRIGV